MSTVTVELSLPEDSHLALQSAGLNREELNAQATKDLALHYADEDCEADLSFSARWYAARIGLK